MKDKFLKLLSKHKIKRNSYYTESPYKNLADGHSKAELTLLENWAHRVEKGWYGLALGEPTPESWFKFLDAFFRLVDQYNPDFVIYQVALKMGRCKIYLGNIDKETEALTYAATNELYDDHLIY